MHAPDLTAMHMGALHPFEQALTIVLAFGPFVVLGAVIMWRRRHDAAEDARAADETPTHETPADETPTHETQTER